MTGAVNAMVTSFQTSFIGAIALSATVPFLWVGLQNTQWMMMFGLGFFAILGHYLVAKAYDLAEASLLSPISYTEMINAVVCGWIFFGDFPDQWTFFGVAILMGCAFYISLHERRVKPAQSANPS
jgi:drug/metabolite transporter (DMT)-like permease